ncbi:hypothetical protein AC579_3138 [Pseudocercospora musae]|uniref:Histone H1 n=1 Tax=Pseudocercospora musae TaxID=113226 RepID=A0A139I510_9PEZI|nr:hypothetical protein AC579_3138 [Pseudocercospora musae]
MIKEAVISAIKKYVLANNNLGGVSDNAFTVQFNKALQKGSDNGTFLRPKGTSGPVKLAATKTADKPAAKKTDKPVAAAAAAANKAPAAKKTAATKKAPAAKKTVATKKTTTTKKAPAAKKAATKTKANTGKARKTPAAVCARCVLYFNRSLLMPHKAPAVEDKAPVVLGKTKSGRVTKSKAPQPVAKTTAPKKKAAAKKATPKKSATPKKA